MAFIKGSDGIARSLKENKDVTYRYADSDVATFLPTNIANIGGANINSGNLIATGQVVSTGNISGGNIITGAQAVATGNISGGNILTSGLVSATGNVTGATVTATNSVKMAVYADDTARDAAITSPTAGQMVFKTDIAKLQFYNGSAWETVTSAV